MFSHYEIPTSKESRFYSRFWTYSTLHAIQVIILSSESSSSISSSASSSTDWVEEEFKTEGWFSCANRLLCHPRQSNIPVLVCGRTHDTIIIWYMAINVDCRLIWLEKQSEWSFLVLRLPLHIPWAGSTYSHFLLLELFTEPQTFYITCTHSNVKFNPPVFHP